MAHLVPVQKRPDVKRGPNRADGVVLMSDGREAEGRHHRRPLVIHTELVHRALVLVQDPLHLTNQIVGLPQRPGVMSSRPGSCRNSTLK
jgi:hypothetical protein